MKITCDNCGAKYQIADEKVTHRVFKIRCKRCDHRIIVEAESGHDDPTVTVAPVVDEPPLADEQATQQVQHDHVSDEGAEWHVVVNREQVGPVTPEDVAGLLGRGEITGDAFVWREGMSEWLKLSSVDSFGHLFDSDSDAGLANLTENPFASAEAEDDILTSSPIEGGGLFAAADAAEAGESEQALEQSEGYRLQGQRNENSVLFSLDDLEQQNRSAQVTNTGGSDGSGLIDISLLGNGPSDNQDAFAGSPAVAPVAVPRSMPSLVSRKRSNTGLIAALVVGGLVLVGVVTAAVIYFMGPKDNVPTGGTESAVAVNSTKKVVIGGGSETKVAEPAAPAPAAPAPAKGDAPTAGIPQASDTKATNRAAEQVRAPQPAKTSKRGGKKVRKKPKKRRSRGKQSSTRKREKVSPAPAPVAAAPQKRQRPKKNAAGGDELDDMLAGVGQSRRPAGARPKPRPSAPAAAPERASNPLLPEKLSRRQILSVVRSKAALIARCKDNDPSLKGTVMVDIMIAGSGSVRSARVASGKFAGTSVGRCVEDRVKGFRFARFSGDAMKLKIPFSIR